VRLSAEVDRARVYVGEKIVLSIRITHNSSEVDDIKLVDLPQFANFWNKEILLTRHVNPARELRINGRSYVTQLIPRFVLYPATSGKLTVSPLTYSMLAHGLAGRISTQTKSIFLKTSPITVDVIPLPDAGRPAEFRGAVGQYKLRAELKDRVTRVGTPARLHIEIEADGNLDALTPPSLPPLSGAKAYDLNRVTIKGSEEQTPPVARWEADIVPTEAGQLTIPPISFAYFDPSSRSYQVIKSEPLELEVAAAEIKPPVSPEPSFGERLSLLFASSRTRYSLLAFLLVVGLGLVFILVRRQKTQEIIAPAEPEPNPAIQEIRKLVNSSYGKLHRGDERAYASDLLRAIRLIFESGFGVSASELTVEKIGELLRGRGADEPLCCDAVNLYQECERICFTPDKAEPGREQSFARFNEARGIIFNLIEFVGDKI
jgi:hypothetical protein